MKKTDREVIEDLVGEDMEDMGLQEHFNDEGAAVKCCTSCGAEIPNESRYGDCEPCLKARFGVGNF